MPSVDELIFNRNLRAQEFAHNRTVYNRIQKLRSLLVIFYFAPLAVYLPVAIFMGFITYVTVAAVDAVILVALAGYLAWQGCYRYKDFSLILLLVVLVCNQLLLSFMSPYENVLLYKFNVLNKCALIHLILLIICGTAAIINLKINITYHKLEESDVFPHFNERFFDQEMDKRQYGIKDPYQLKMEKLQKNASSDMSDVSVADLKERSNSENNSGYMDGI
ncbi:hypothetical protein [Ruminococcus flavefaciens]|uniref:hypothetical protein n=1 Tax=Ruminococcus flavefaciens TaxID=1265 RepID=UPI0026ED5299|nr:hypothetical protein [Ruminococcus flavefaciens]MDD7517641.1 hypothetical protein [Ruminococcus flavefaciens]MDY5691331.1 hypothetical protein [Ruminococcus flavefaciens]